MSEQNDPSNLYDVPDEWSWSAFDTICAWSQYGITATADEGGKYPMLRMNNLQDGKIDVTDLVYINLEDDDFSKHRLAIGELLVNRTNSYDLVGKTAIVEADHGFICASYIVRFGLDTSLVEPRFVNYFFNSITGQKQLKTLATKGVSQANINPTSLKKNFRVPVPPLPEQRKIAEILSTWDEAIATVNAILAALRRRKQGLMHRLLTGQVRFGEFAGSEWKVAKAGDIFGPISVRKNGDEELLSVTQNQGVIPRSMLETRVVMPEGSTEGYKLVEPGDFIISLRTFQGGIEYSDYRGLVSPAYTVLKPQLPIKQGFYKYFFKSQEFIGRLSVAVIGIRDGKQISFNGFAAMRLPYPLLAEQERIACVLQTCDDDIAVHERKLMLLKQQKKGLMQRLLTGQVRVGMEEKVL